MGLPRSLQLQGARAGLGPPEELRLGGSARLGGGLWLTCRASVPQRGRPSSAVCEGAALPYLPACGAVTRRTRAAPGNPTRRPRGQWRIPEPRAPLGPALVRGAAPGGSFRAAPGTAAPRGAERPPLPVPRPPRPSPLPALAEGAAG